MPTALRILRPASDPESAPGVLCWLVIRRVWLTASADLRDDMVAWCRLTGEESLEKALACVANFSWKAPRPFAATYRSTSVSRRVRVQRVLGCWIWEYRTTRPASDPARCREESRQVGLTSPRARRYRLCAARVVLHWHHRLYGYQFTEQVTCA